jgi:GNAT superfamily N-acetyltransferase
MVFVAEDPISDGRLASIGAANIASRLPGPGNPEALVGYIQWVSTDPSYRRQGLARQITEALFYWLWDQKASVVELHASPNGEPLYRSLGFEDLPNPALQFRL